MLPKTPMLLDGARLPRKPPGRAVKPELLFFDKSLPITPVEVSDSQSVVAANDFAIFSFVVVPS